MQKKMIIGIIAVVAVVSAAAAYFVINNDDGDDEIHIPDFSDCFMDITDAKSLALCETNGNTTNSNALLFDDGNTKSTRLYKITENGQFKSVDMYRFDKNNMKSIVNPDRKIVDIVSLDGFIMVEFDRDYKNFVEFKDLYANGITYDINSSLFYLVSESSGKMYDISPLLTEIISYKDLNGRDQFDTVRIDPFMGFYYIGSDGQNIYFIINKAINLPNTPSPIQYKSIYKATERDGSMIFEEILNKDFLGDKYYRDVKIADNGDIVLNISDISDSYVYTPSKSILKGEYVLYDGFVCRNLSFINEIFPSECYRIDSDGNEHFYSYNAEESFQSAILNHSKNCMLQISEGSSTTMVLMERNEYGRQNINKITLNEDLTYSSTKLELPSISTQYGDSFFNRLHVISDGEMQTNGHSFMPHVGLNTMGPYPILKAFYQNEHLYFATSEGMYDCNLLSLTINEISIPGLIMVNSVSLQNGILIFEGISPTMQKIKGTLDSEGNFTTEFLEIPLDVITFIALN